MGILPKFTTLGICLLLTGCAGVSSTPVTQHSIVPGSISYALQDSIVEIKISNVAHGVSYKNITINSRAVADRENILSISMPSGAFSAENITISVDEKSNLLTSVNSTVDGKLDEVFSEAANSIGALRGSGFLTDGGTPGNDPVTVASFRAGNLTEFKAAQVEFSRRTGYGLVCLSGCIDQAAKPPVNSAQVIYYRISLKTQAGDMSRPMLGFI